MAETTSEIVKSWRYHPVDEITRNSLDNPKVIKGRSGIIAFGTDKGIGYKPVNEDAVYINTMVNVFASIDGMGGMGNGGKAAHILAQEIQMGVKRKLKMRGIISNASKEMRRHGIEKGGACYIFGHIRKNVLNVFQAGDVKLIVIDREGNVRFETQDENKEDERNKVLNSVQGINSGEITENKVRLNIGDKIVVASDGLWDNYEPQQIAKYVYNKNVKQSIDGINEAVKSKMKSESKTRSRRGKCDNINVIIYDIKRFSHSSR